MNWKNIKNVVADAAPLLGTLVGGPAGTTVGALISNALGTESNPEAVIQELKNNPDAFLKLKNLEIENEKHLREMAVEQSKAELKDVAHARESHQDSKMPSVITLVLTLIVTLYGSALFFVEFPESNRDMINYFGGQLIAIWVSSIVYWVGTSKSSADKNKWITRK